MRICPIACALIAGCASLTNSGRDCPPECTDASAGDAGVEAFMDGGRVAPTHNDGGGVDAGGIETDDVRDGAACANGLDEDSDGLMDCNDDGCSSSAFCCLGSGAPQCCPATTNFLSVDFATCAEPTPGACVPGSITFGSPSPLLEGGAFVPNGDVSDAGLVLGAPIDPTRERVILRGRFAAQAGGCADCLDAVALGVGGGAEGSMVWVEADAAVVVRASRGDYALVIAGEVVGSAALPSDGLAHEYTLELSPDGAVSLALDSGVPMTATWFPQPARRVLLWGRTRNRPAGAPPPARAERVSISLGACEIPSALSRDGALALGDESWGSVVARAPSVVLDGSMLLAFEGGGDIHLARENGDQWTLVSGDLDMPAVTSLAPLADPSLVREGDRWVIYATHGPIGERRIARAEGEPGLSTSFAAPEDVSAPDEIAELWAPSALVWSGRSLIAATATLDDDSTPRVVLLETFGDGLTWANGTASASTIATPRGDLFAFDADEVGAPALYTDASNILRVYYAGRRGARWSIGVRVSVDALSWVRAPELVLEGAGAGHDALDVRDPSVVRAGSDLVLFYTASDGFTTTLGRAIGETRW